MRLEQNVIMTSSSRRIRTFLIVCLPSCLPSAHPVTGQAGGHQQIGEYAGEKNLLTNFPDHCSSPAGPLFGSRDGLGSFPALLFPRDEERGLLGRYGGQGRVEGGRVRRRDFHWTDLRPALRVLRPGAGTGPSTPDHRFLCVQLSRETAKNRLKSLGFWN